MNSALLEKFQAARKPQISARFKNLSGGWREIGGKRMFFRSRWEYNYAAYLEFLLQHGEIKEWQHEPRTFYFDGIRRGVTNYKPDFRIVEKTGREVWVEVKGYMDRKSATKLKRMRIYFPQVRMLLVDSKWFKANGRKLGAIVPNWEHEKIKI